MASMPQRVATLLAVLSASGLCDVVLDLGSQEWALTNSNGSVQCAGSVPGGVHTDLLACGLIGYPDYGYNDQI